MNAETREILEQTQQVVADFDQRRKLSLLAVGLEALSLRVLNLLALLLSAGMFGWALAKGGYDSLLVAVCFAVTAWCIIKLTPPPGGSRET